MPCYHPLAAWKSKSLTVNGKRGITFRPDDGFTDKPLELPCGRCIGCRLERSRQWAVRCMHEAKCWEDNCFITLTYNEENCPPSGSLVPRHFVLFMKKLRAKYGKGIRFFHCGEYGEKLMRPHHHAILFNFDFPDKKVHSVRDGIRLYRSDILDALWGFGFCSIGEATFESAAYVARYAMKKVYGPDAKDYYEWKVPEYLTMSRRPGIGASWIKKFQGDVYPADEVIVNGHRCKPPRYYDEWMRRYSIAPITEDLKRKRKVAAKDNPDGTGKRLIVREAVKTAAVKFLKRSPEVS